MCPTQAIPPIAEITCLTFWLALSWSNTVKICLGLATLVLSSTRYGKLEVAGAASQLAVDLAVAVESVVNSTALLLVKDNLKDLAAILFGADSLANNLDWVDNVGKDSVVDSGQSTRTRSLLGLAGAGSVGSLWLGQNAAGSQEDDLSVRELLLQLTGQTLLDLVEVLEQRDWHKDDNGALVGANIELSCRLDLQRSQRRLEIGNVGLEFVQSSRNVDLQLRWVSSRGAVGRDLVQGWLRHFG